MITIFRRPYVTDLLWICLEVNEIATASIIYEEIMKKGPISSDDYEMISQIKEDLKNDLWGKIINNFQVILYMHSNLDIANKLVRAFLFTMSNNSLYQM